MLPQRRSEKRRLATIEPNDQELQGLAVDVDGVLDYTLGESVARRCVDGAWKFGTVTRLAPELLVSTKIGGDAKHSQVWTAQDGGDRPHQRRLPGQELLLHACQSVGRTSNGPGTKYNTAAKIDFYVKKTDCTDGLPSSCPAEGKRR